MRIDVAKYILKKAGLSAFKPSELRDLLPDRYAPLRPEVKEAIKTIIKGE